MKKSELVPGTVYAYLKDTYSSPRPVRLVGTDLLKSRSDRDTETKKYRTVLFAAPKGAVPGRNTWSGSVGYLTLVPKSREHWGALAEVDVEALLKECVEAGEIVKPKDERFELELMNNRFFIGTWTDVDAAQTAKDARVAANNKVGRDWEEATQKRYFAARKTIEDAIGTIVRGAVPEYVSASATARSGVEEGVYRSKGSVVLYVEDMEALAALLSAKES